MIQHVLNLFNAFNVFNMFNMFNVFNMFNMVNMFNVFNVFNVLSIVSVLMLRIFSSFPPHLLISSSNKENLLLQIFTKSFQNFLYNAFWKNPLAEHKVSHRVVGLPVYKEPTAGPVLEKIERFSIKDVSVCVCQCVCVDLGRQNLKFVSKWL